MDRSQSIQKIENLIQKFRSEKGEKLNEAETRLRFIDPFFEALGWNIRNPREVRIESALVRSDSTRPDYRFLIEGKTKFFVEAKKPSVKLTDPAPVFQAKSYGFSSKVPLVILTDFEEFRPFRTLARPKYDRPLDGLIKEYDLTYENYVEKFDPLYDTFSHDAVFAGELEKRIPTEKKEASATVDKEFLKDLSNWQEELAKNIALRNSKLTVSEINEAVQRILDRIIFLRICEDRQIEESKILLSYAEKESIYQNLLKEFTRLRSKYNGLIFNEHRLSEQLSIDDKLLKDIIKNLYLPYSPYRFNEIPIEILGTIYEQYLGKVITLTPTHRAKVEVKPEVRKAGGVFYTPQFITSYIVKNTIGKLLQPCEGSEPQGLTPQQITKMKFADIACGSGSFLLEMFDYLIRYHIDYYSAHTDKIKTTDGVPDAYQTPYGLWHLSTRKKKEILINNIYGVDIDPQAVEVTQMSLYLKLLEGENAESFDKQLSLDLKETILPTLSNNIKCGNSLVGIDIKGLGNNLTLEEELRIRPFDWATAFPEIMNPSSSLRCERSGGGFDAIVGNPPYLKLTHNNLDKIMSSYFEQNYKSIKGGGSKNLFQLFIERALALKPKFISYIVPEALLTTSSNHLLRQMMLEEMTLSSLVVFDSFVFQDATIGSTIFVLEKKGKATETFVQSFNESGKRSIKKILVLDKESPIWDTSSQSEYALLLEKISGIDNFLGSLVEMSKGMVVKDREKYLKPTNAKMRLPFLLGNCLARYNVQYKYFAKYEDLTIIGGTKNLARHHQIPRLLIRRTGSTLCVAFSENRELIESTIYILTSNKIDLKYLLGVLNSKLMTFYLKQKLLTNTQGFPQVLMSQLEQLPIRTIDFNNPEEKAMHDQLVQFVERMLDLHKKKQKSKTDSEKELFEHQIKATDKEIDQLVYRLYDLTDEEIRIIEARE